MTAYLPLNGNVRRDVVREGEPDPDMFQTVPVPGIRLPEVAHQLGEKVVPISYTYARVKDMADERLRNSTRRRNCIKPQWASSRVLISKYECAQKR